MKLSKKIQAVIDSDYTSYKIEKESGIAPSTFGRFRSGKRDIKNMTLDIAEKLEVFYDKYLANSK